LYRAALAFIYTSRYEGFGLPLVEAMASGTPIVAARASATPEVTADAAILVEPGDVTAFADAIVRLGREADTRETLRARGLARARLFTWRETARRTLEVYRGLVVVPIPSSSRK
jgi:glycosyltransferase involved in cell wall biosynthesis